MIYNNRMVLLVLCFLISGGFLFSCSKEPVKADPASLVISDMNYTIRETHKNNSYVLDAKGKIKNTGKLDVKNVVVTAFCKSCVLEFTSHKWFISDCAKTPNQKAVIAYLPAGTEAQFGFEEVAFYFSSEKKPPAAIPEKIEPKVVSFDTVQGS